MTAYENAAFEFSSALALHHRMVSYSPTYQFSRRNGSTHYVSFADFILLAIFWHSETASALDFLSLTRAWLLDCCLEFVSKLYILSCHIASIGLYWAEGILQMRHQPISSLLMRLKIGPLGGVCQIPGTARQFGRREAILRSLSRRELLLYLR